MIVISLTGLYYYNYVQDKEKLEAYNNLETFAKQKMNEVVNWRNERISDAKFIYEIAPVKKLVHSFLENPNSDKLKKEIVQWLKPIKENHEYVNIIVVNNLGSVYSLFKSSDSLSDYDKVLWQQSIRSKEIVLAGFYKNPHTNEITLSNFIPLFHPEIDNGNVFGVMELRIDPKKIFYPLVNVAPIKSQTAETFLVSPDGDSITFLNELRFKKNSALSFKLPISLKNLPAAMAIKGKRGIYEGVDYKNAEVLAHLDQIPESQWFIVSKIDIDEIYAPIRESAAYILAGVITLILLGGSIVFIAWKNEKIRSFSRQLHLEQQKKDLFKNMSEGYAYCRMLFEEDIPTDFIYLEVNDAFSEITGLKNVTGKKVTEIIPGIKETNPELFEIYGRVSLTGVPEKFETFVDSLGTWFSVSAYSPEREYFVSIFNDITGQKNYLIELKKLSRAVEQSPASVVITDLNGLIEYVNPKFTEVTGYTLEEVIGKNPRILKSGKTPKYIFTKLWKTITAGKEWRGELYNKKKNGELYWEFASISPIKNEDGINTHYIAVKEDITKRKQIEKELEASEERFSKAFRSNPNALVISRIADGTVLEVNETYLKLFGHSRSEIIGNSSMALNMFVNPDDREKAVQLLKNNGSVNDFELKIKAKNGEERTALLSLEFLKISGEQSILTILQDITERREAEQKLKISEQHYREVVETQQELLVRVDMEGRFTFVNEAYCKKFGFKKEDLIGKSTFKPLVYPDDLPATLEKMKELESPPYRITMEQRAYTSEGLRWIEWSDTAIVDDNGTIIEIQGVGRDIHDRKEAERALRESEKLLKTTQEISHLGSWQLDLINNKLTWSDEVYKIFGLKPQEFKATYEAFLEAVHPEDREAVNEAYSSSIRDGKDTYEIEHRVIRRATGEIRFVREKCEHFKDRSGKIFLSIGMVHDITEQKQTENELNESLSLHKTISSTVPFGMQIVDKTGMILFANESILKFAAENIKGQKCWEIYKDDKKQCNDCPLPNPRPVGTTTMIEVEGVLGGRIFEIYHTEMIYKGKPALLEIFQDITSRQKAKEALRLSEQSFRHLADSMPQLVWTADPDGTVDYYNSQVEEFDGIS
ncbi:MAG: PAS domain S-box protein, partial [Ignavibacteria bacterium]